MPENRNNKGCIEFYCHKCSEQVENVIYAEDNSTNPSTQIWLCDKCINLHRLFSKRNKKFENITAVRNTVQQNTENTL